jgi:rsbT co-antagonist protein RsbR
MSKSTETNTLERSSAANQTGAGLQTTAEHFRMLVENIKDYAIIILDTNGRVASWNPGSEIIMGYRSEEIIGQHFSRFFPSEEVQRGRPEMELKVATAEGRSEDEGWRIKKDGSRFWSNEVITVLRDQAGTLCGFGKVMRDLTERKRAEEKATMQAREILEISTPVIQIWDGVLMAPLVGTLDSERTQQLMERLLERIVETNSAVALLDVTGVPTIDTRTAQHLAETTTAVRLLGAQAVLTGVRPAIAQTLAHLGVYLGDITTRSSLAAGLRVALDLLNLQVVGGNGSGRKEAQ